MFHKNKELSRRRPEVMVKIADRVHGPNSLDLRKSSAPCLSNAVDERFESHTKVSDDIQPMPSRPSLLLYTKTFDTAQTFVIAAFKE